MYFEAKTLVFENRIGAYLKVREKRKRKKSSFAAQNPLNYRHALAEAEKTIAFAAQNPLNYRHALAEAKKTTAFAAQNPLNYRHALNQA